MARSSRTSVSSFGSVCDAARQRLDTRQVLLHSRGVNFGEAPEEKLLEILDLWACERGHNALLPINLSISY